MRNYALDALVMERDLLQEKAEIKRSSLRHFSQDVTADVKEWEFAISQIDAAIASLRKSKIIPKPIQAPPSEQSDGVDPLVVPVARPGATIRKGCKHVAKCGQFSLVYCKQQCIKYKNQTCDLLRYRKRRK